jgi:hypothetical protein
MTEDELKALNELDLSKLSMADIQAVSNLQVRNALVAALRAILVSPDTTHTSHGKHTSFLAEIARD